MKKTLFAPVFVLFFAGCGHAQKVDNTPVASLDLQRYLGDWYEIARFDHRFERGLDFCKANYALREDGKITVDEPGFYTLYVITQSRRSFRTLLYVED